MRISDWSSDVCSSDLFMAVVLVGGTVLFMLLGERLIPDFNHGVLLAILLVTTVLRALYMLNISTTKGYENFRATATIAVIGAPLNLLLILVVWWLDGPMEWFLGTYTVSRLVFWWISRRPVAPLLPPPDSRAPRDDPPRKRLRSCYPAGHDGAARAVHAQHQHHQGLRELPRDRDHRGHRRPTQPAADPGRMVA